VNVKDMRGEAMARFIREAGWGAAELNPLPGDASTRRYVRLHMGGRSALVMDQPQNAESAAASAEASPEERRALGYNALARLAGADCARFVAAAQHLRKMGLAAPDIYAADTARGFLLIEDLGDDLYTDVLSRQGSETALYEAAIDALVRIHAEPAPKALAPGIPLFAYDETALLAETDLLTEWFLPAALGRPARDTEIAEHRALWRDAIGLVVSGEKVFVHRDYHAQNLLWRAGRAGLARVGMIDFQDALAGSPAYDVVSLLEDARRDVSPGLARAMTERYIATAGASRERFMMSAAILAAQRNAKIIGIFARLAKRDRKPRYLAHLPRVWRYMEGDLSHPSLAKLNAWYGRVLPKDRRGIPPLAEARA